MKSIKTEFHEKGKVSKAIEYYEAYKPKAEQLNAEIIEIRDKFEEGGVEKDVTPQKDDFSFKSNPKNRNLYIEQMHDIENKLKQDKFPALGTMSFVYELLGKLCGLVAVGFILIILFSSGFDASQKAVGIVSFLISGAILVVTIIAIAESIKLGVEIEKNSRATMEYIKVLVEKTISDK